MVCSSYFANSLDIDMVTLKFFLCLVMTAALIGCARPELYTGVNEHQANEMVSLLQTAGIEAKKEMRESGNYAITTQPENFSRAIELLQANGLPRSSFDSVGQVFKKEGLVSSPMEERARLTYALSQELAATLQAIDGVVTARVHLAVPDKDPLSDKPKPASASVFIKHRAGRDLSAQVGAMKALVVNGVEGLPYDKISVALFAADAVSAAPPMTTPGSQMGWLLLVVGAMGIMLLAFGVILWCLRRRAGVPPKTELVLVKGHHANHA
jgi:type III secretion protein J